MMLATSKHFFKIKTCRNLFKNYDLLSAVSIFLSSFNFSNHAFLKQVFPDSSHFPLNFPVSQKQNFRLFVSIDQMNHFHKHTNYTHFKRPNFHEPNLSRIKPTQIIKSRPLDSGVELKLPNFV